MPAVTVKGMQPACYVIMGFGRKTDFETGRVLDLDATYRTIIKPAVEAAGLECVRADEIVHPGIIEQPDYNFLLTADVVIADLSTSNPHALYELGVRHALRPSTTIVIAEDKLWSLPFDMSLVPVRRYKHLGEDIGFAEAMRFTKELTAVIVETLKREPRPMDSPVYTFLHGLNPPTWSTTGVAAERGLEVRPAMEPATVDISTQNLLQEADEAQKMGDFVTAKRLLKFLHESKKAQTTPGPDWVYLTQRLALATYKSKQPTELEALQEARALLSSLDPASSNDAETLGLWGAVHRRLWDKAREPAALDEAIRSYERGFYLRKDYYNGINFAFMLNIRAARSASRADAIADFVQAGRVRREVIALCETELSVAQTEGDERYWVLATLAEAYLGIGDEARSVETVQQALALARYEWMRSSTMEQLAKVRLFLADSPLKSL